MSYKRSLTLEWGGNARNPNPRCCWLWVARIRADTLFTTIEERHLLWGTRWLVTLRWTKAFVADADYAANKEQEP